MIHQLKNKFLLLIGFWCLVSFSGFAQVTEIFLQGTRDTEAYEGDTVTVPIIVKASGLSSENILAFRLEFTGHDDMDVIGFSTENTLISSWNYNANPTGGSDFIISAAGISPIAADSGVLFYVTYALKEVTRDVTAYYYLRNGGDNYFNEGGYTVSMTSDLYGRIEINNIPTLSVNINGSSLVRGDSTVVGASGGTDPYTYVSTDSNIAEMLPSGYLGLKNVGKVTVIAEDANGLVGESNEIDVLGYRLTNDWEEGVFYPEDTVDVAISTSTLADLDVLAGEMRFRLSNGSILNVFTDETCLLNNADIEYRYDSLTGYYELSFASAQVINGEGPLFKSEILIDELANSVNISSVTVLFNETLNGVHSASSLPIESVPNLSVAAQTSIPNPLLPGDTILYAAANGTEPYGWSTTDESVAIIDQEGNLIPVGSGEVQVVVADQEGLTGTSSALRVYDGTFTVASETAVYGSEHLLPVYISDLPDGRELLAYEMRMDIDTSRITFVSVEKAGTLSEDFSIVTNSNIENQIKIVGAAQQPVDGEGVLFYFKIKLKDAFTTGNTYIYPRNAIFNEGLPEMYIYNGVVTPGDPPPVAGPSSIEVQEDVIFNFVSTDFAYTQEQGKEMTRVKIVTLPTEGALLYNGNPINVNAEYSVAYLASLGYLPPADEFGDAFDSFEVKVGDADSYSNNTGIVTVNISSVNDAPRFAISQDTLKLDEDFANAASLSVVASHPLHEEAEVYSYSLSGDDTQLINVAVDASTGAISFTAVADANGSAWVVIAADDSQTENNVGFDSVYVVVNPVNDAPVATAQNFSMEENLTNQVIDSVLVTDVDGDVLTYSFLSGNESGYFALEQNTGKLSVTDSAKLDFESKTSYELSVQVTDTVETITVAVTVNVLDVNEAPSLADYTFQIAENSTLNAEVGIVTGTDPEADALVYSFVNASTIFSIHESTGVISVLDSAALDFEKGSSYLYEVQVSDGNLTGSGNVIIQVLDVNEAPKIETQSFVIAENSANGTLVGTMIASDPDADALIYSIEGGSSVFAIDPSTAKITVIDQAALDFEVSPVFVFQVAVFDGSLTTSATVTVDLTDVDETVNQAPQILAQTFTIAENSVAGTVIGTVVASDPDNDALTYSIVGGSSVFALDANAGTLTVVDAAALDYETVRNFTLQIEVTDGNLNSSGMITVHLSDVDDTINEVPVIANQSFTIAENSIAGTVVGTIVATDADGDTLTFSISGGSTVFALDAKSGVLTVADAAALDFETVQSFSLNITVTDGKDSNSATVTVNLTDVDETVNQAPQIVAQTFSIAENSAAGSVIGTVAASDPDNNDLTYSIVGGSSIFSIHPSVGVLSVLNSAALDYETVQSFSLEIAVSDGDLTGSTVIVVNVIDVDDAPNQAPEITAQTFSIAENSAVGSVVGTVVASDPDNNLLTYSIVGGSSIFSLHESAGVITVLDSAALDFETVQSFSLEVSVSDGNLSSSAAVTVNLTDVDETVNQAPQIVAQSFSIAENSAVGTIVGTVAASDPDNDALTYSIVGGSSVFNLDASTGVLTVLDGSALDFETVQSFSLEVSVSDGNLSSSAVITVNLTDVDETVNQAPQIVAQSFSIAENSAVGTVVGTVAASDPDNDALTYSIVGGSSIFSLDASTGLLTVLDGSVLDFETVQSFSLEVSVSDGSLSSSAVVTVNLTDVDETVNQAPQIVAQSFSIAENSAIGTVVGTVAASDPDNDALTYSIVGGSTVFSLDASTGVLTVLDGSALDFETVQSFSLEVSVSDGSLSSSAAVTVNLTDVDENQAPEIADQSFSIEENSAVGTTVGTLVATDANGDALTYTITAGNTSDAFGIGASTGIIKVFNADVLDFETTPVFELTVSVSDGSLSANAKVIISLTDVDENALAIDEEVVGWVYPNPVRDQLKVSGQFGTGTYEVVALDGKVVQSGSVSSSGIIDVSSLNNAVYLIRLSNNESSYLERVIKY